MTKLAHGSRMFVALCLAASAASAHAVEALRDAPRRAVTVVREGDDYGDGDYEGGKKKKGDKKEGKDAPATAAAASLRKDDSAGPETQPPPPPKGGA